MPDATVPMTTPAPAARGKVREVLVVDDLPEIGDFFKALIRRLREFDIHLTTEVNSARALEMVSERPFDLVVSDFRMRQVDGIEVLRAAYDKNPRGLRILMTGYNEIPTSVDRIRAARVDAYIQKPLKSQDLLLLIFDFLNGNVEAIESCRRYAREMETLGAREEAEGGDTGIT
jgi:DNA-binding NtrC family response regulator